MDDHRRMSWTLTPFWRSWSARRICFRVSIVFGCSVSARPVIVRSGLLSTMTTLMPNRTRFDLRRSARTRRPPTYASIKPAGPAPTMATSYSTGGGGSSRGGSTGAAGGGSRGISTGGGLGISAKGCLGISTSGDLGVSTSGGLGISTSGGLGISKGAGGGGSSFRSAARGGIGERWFSKLWTLRRVDFGRGSSSSILTTNPEKSGLRDDTELLRLPLLLLLLVPTLSWRVWLRRHSDMVAEGAVRRESQRMP